VRFTGDKGTLPEFRTKRDVAGLSPVRRPFECNQEVVEVWPLALICAERTRQTRRFQSSGAPRVPLSPRGERREIERQRAGAQNYAERLRAGSEPALVCPAGRRRGTGPGPGCVLVTCGVARAAPAGTSSPGERSVPGPDAQGTSSGRPCPFQAVVAMRQSATSTAAPPRPDPGRVGTAPIAFAADAFSEAPGHSG
jgi:hypothetical protein